MRQSIVILAGALCVASATQCSIAHTSEHSTKESSLVAPIIAFDVNQNGKLAKSEVNEQGVLTKGQLIALAQKLDADEPPGDRGGRSDQGDRGDKGGPPPEGAEGPGRAQGPGGPGGPRGPREGPPQPGQILPPRVQDALKLTDDQKKQLAELQQEIDQKLAKILTEDQLNQMKKMRERGPGGRGARPGSPPPPRDGANNGPGEQGGQPGDQPPPRDGANNGPGGNGGPAGPPPGSNRPGH